MRWPGKAFPSVNIWGQSLPCRGRSKGKGPEVGACLSCSRKDKEVSVAGAGRMRGEGGSRGSGEKGTAPLGLCHMLDSAGSML